MSRGNSDRSKFPLRFQIEFESCVKVMKMRERESQHLRPERNRFQEILLLKARTIRSTEVADRLFPDGEPPS